VLPITLSNFERFVEINNAGKNKITHATELNGNQFMLYPLLYECHITTDAAKNNLNIPIQSLRPINFILYSQ